MDIASAVIAGLIATAVMTAIMYAAPYVGLPKMDIMGMLGTMFMEPGTTALILGAIIHFMMGAIFAIIYAFFWTNVLGDPTWLWGIIFGLVHGIIVVFTMPMIQGMHPRAEQLEMEMGGMAIVGMLMGHAIFGLVVALVYNALI